jgi:predicted signal transduction protein with EAL and GGDEF domain
VVAEGVENDWQARLLQLLGCDYLQGYYVGAPMNLEKLREFRAAKASSPKIAASANAYEGAYGSVLAAARHR